MPERMRNAGPGDRRWYTVSAKVGNTAEVFIYDEIGEGFFGGGVAAETLIKEIGALKLGKNDELLVRINSPGGDFFEGNTIYNYLRTMKSRITTRIDGVAASAASIVAMAGDRIEMPENAMLFIHNPRMFMFKAGDATTMRKAADDLDKMRDSAVGTYLRRTGDKLTREDLIAMLDAETWLSATEAVEKGLADVINEPVRAVALAKFDFSLYGIQEPLAISEARSSREMERQSQRERLKKLAA